MIATAGVILSAVYMLWAVRSVFFGPLANAANQVLVDLGAREKLVAVALVIPMVWIGVHPSTFTNPMDRAVTELLETMSRRGADLAAWQNPTRLELAPVAASVRRGVAMIPQIDVGAVAPMIPVALGVLVLPMFEVVAVAHAGAARPARLAPRAAARTWPRASVLFLSASLLLTLNAFSAAAARLQPREPDGAHGRRGAVPDARSC